MKPVFSGVNPLDLERYGMKPVEVKPVAEHKCEPCRLPHKAQCKRSHATEARDQMLFNAGRFAAGATDKVALAAHDQLMKELGE